MLNSRGYFFDGVGNKVAGAPTSADAIRLAGLDWGVEQAPIFSEFGGEKIAIPNSFANIRTDNKQVLGTVKDRYKVVQNTEAFSFTDSLLGEGVTYETAGALGGGKQIWLLAKTESSKILDDVVEPYLLFSNSHDGSSKVKVTFTPVRVVCRNTLAIALKRAERVWSVKHTGAIGKRLDEAIETLQMKDKYIDAMRQEAEDLAKIKMSKDDFIKVVDEIYPVADDTLSKRAITTNEHYRENLISAYNQQDLGNIRDNAWGVVNAIADFETHAESARKTDNQDANIQKVLMGYVVMNTAIQIIRARFGYGRI